MLDANTQQVVFGPASAVESVILRHKPTMTLIEVEPAPSVDGEAFANAMEEVCAKLNSTPQNHPTMLYELPPSQQRIFLKHQFQGDVKLHKGAFYEFHGIEKKDGMLMAAKMLRALKTSYIENKTLINQNDIEHGYREFALPVQTEGVSRAASRDAQRDTGQGFSR